jgi:hypothetical protein
MLRAQNKIVVRDIKTGDENWIYFDEGPGSIWRSSEQQAPARLRLTIASEKRMLVVFWGVQGIVDRVWLPNDMRLNAELSLPEVLEPISQKLRPGSSANQHVTIVHMGNARQHDAVGVISKLQIAQNETEDCAPAIIWPWRCPGRILSIWLVKERASATNVCDRRQVSR